MLAKRLKIFLALLCSLAIVIPSNAQAAPQRIPPSPDAPLCPTHNNTKFHGLWDSERGCHYDHTHNDDPASANAIFGSAGALWSGQSVSYPWMTANENDMGGHTGYKYYVNLNPQPNCAAEGYGYLGSINCVSGFRIQYHDAGGNAHMVKRFHSYYMEAQVQKGSVKGTIQTGGWADFGCLHEAYKTNFLPLPGIDPVQANGQTACGPGGQTIHSDPYRAPKNTWQQIQGRTSGDNMWIWTAHNRYGYNNTGYFFYRTLDNWGSIDASDPYKEHFLCPDFKCKFNDSEHHVFTVYAMIPAALDTDKDGIVNYTGYTDIKGNIVQGCTAPGANCVPLKIVNAPVGVAIWSRNTSGPRPAGEPVRDHDIYFNGRPSGWITFQGHKHDSPASTATPPQSQTPVVTATGTSVFTPTPTAVNPATATPLSTLTSVPPTSTNVTMPTSTSVTVPTNTVAPTNTKPPVPPTSLPNAQTIAPASLKTEDGTTKGSLASLGSLKQTGTNDNPGEYVVFQTPGSSAYKGYLSFKVPANIPAASVSEMSLVINFKGTATSKQKWMWSIYNWDKKKWVELGTASGTQKQWQLLKFKIPMRKEYGSAGNEVRIQLRSNNKNGNAKIDYQVLLLMLGSPASAQKNVLPAVTQPAASSPTIVESISTATPHAHP